jgi:glutathione S-transferase
MATRRLRLCKADSAAHIRAAFELREEAARWLLEKGIPQWQPGEVPLEIFERRSQNGSLYVALDGAADTVAATVFLDEEPPVVWKDGSIHSSVDQQGISCLYLSGLVVARFAAGCGAEVLELVGSEVSRRGFRRIRLDCFDGNSRLREFYNDAGYTDCGAVPEEDWYVRLFERRLPQRTSQAQLTAVYGDQISGNCMKVKWVADLLGLSYEWRETSVLAADTRTAQFLELNPAGQVPLAVLSNGRTLAQSNAIMLYLAEGTDLIPDDPFERALMHQWLFWEQYSHEHAIAVLRFQRRFLNRTDEELSDSALPEKCISVLRLMNEHLTERSYFVGEHISLADIALVAYTRWSHHAGFELEPDYASVAAWVRRIETELSVEHVAEGDSAL